jgi:hypothetical protein
MARKVGVIILMLLIWGLINTTNLIFSQTERATKLSQDYIKPIITLFSQMCNKNTLFPESYLSSLKDFRMIGWSNIENWTKVKYNNMIIFQIKTIHSDLPFIKYNYLQFVNDVAKNTFCTKNFHDQYFITIEPNSILNYLDRQALLFDDIVDKFELYNWKSIDSYRAKSARIDNFKREILNKAKSNNTSLTFYIPDPYFINNPSILKSKLLDLSKNTQMLLQPRKNAKGLDKMWVDEIRMAIRNCKKNEIVYPTSTLIFYTPNATITLSWKEVRGEGNFWEMKMEFSSIGDQQKIQNLIENLDKVIANSKQVLSQKNNIKSWWENASPINLDYIDELEKFKKDKLDPLNLNYTNTEAEARNYIQALICEKTPGGRDANTLLDNLSEKASSTAQALEETAEYISIHLKPATITVTTTEVSIAVLPPKLFGGEHKGAESLAEITPERIFNEIRDFLFKLAPTLFILLLVVGAIFYLISPINLQNIQTGSEYIKWAIIGYFLLLVVTGIISAVRVIFGGP